MPVQAGGCNCGSVRYHVTGEPLFVHACHCRACQTRSGGAFGLTMFLSADQLEITQGPARAFSFTADSGAVKTAYFCPACGVHLWNESASAPGLLGLRPGTFDATDWFDIGAHIWIGSKQPWLKLSSHIPAFQRSYVRHQLWPRDSLARLPRAPDNGV